ncbi:MAG: hypothetical protein ACFE0Q_16595 [Anaerolineae bacterium]
MNDALEHKLQTIHNENQPDPIFAEQLEQELRSIHSSIYLTEPIKPHSVSIVRRIVAIAASFLIVLGLFATVPPLRVVAQDIIGFFIAGEETIETSVVIGGDASAEHNPYSLSISELQDQVAEMLYLPTYLPDGYVYDGGSYDLQQERSIITYRCSPLHSIGLTAQPVDDMAQIMPYEVGESANIIDVDIDGTYGQYVRGFWVLSVPNYDSDAPAPDEPIQEPAEAVWTNDSDHQMLWWHDANIGLSFVLSTMSGSVHSEEQASACDLDMADFVRIAESMTAQR